VFGGPTYRINTQGKRKTVHVRFLKEYVERTVKRITTVLEDDTVEDDVMITNSKIELETMVKSPVMVEKLEGLVEEFKCVVKAEPGLTDSVEAGINTGDAAPVTQRPYNTPVSAREALKKEIEWLQEKKFIRPSHSEWASHLVTVKKPDGSLRLYIDYKRLNALTIPSPFYMPTINELLEKAGTAQFISTVDLNKGFYQVAMSPADIEKTTFICHEGHFEFLRMQFGLKNAPAVFQRLTSRVLEPCRKYALPYIDDIIIFSSD